MSATISALRSPRVSVGHVAGWVGVDGRGLDGRYGWLQIGLSTKANGTGADLYVEASGPGRDPRYTVLRRAVPIGQKHRFAVLEIRGRPGWWRAWLDGRPETGPLHLPGSHDSWTAEATAESWNDSSGECNLFSYAFGLVELAGATAGGWRGLSAADFFEDPGYDVARVSGSSFVASSAPLP